MRNYYFVVLLAILLTCGNKWNSNFTKVNIDKKSILIELPYGSKYEQLTLYIKKNNIAKYTSKKSSGYSEKDYSKKNLPDFDIKQKDKLEYVVTIEGHKKYFTFPYYYHPILYFCYDKNDTLIYVGMHGYP